MTLETLRLELAEELAAMQAIMQEILFSPLPEINAMVAYHLQARGKQLRPLLVLLPARLAGSRKGRRRDQAIKLAAAVEILHLATLLHDDVLDGAGLRHGQPSLNQVYGNQAAILLGDHFFSRAMALAATISRAVVREISQVITALVAGEFRQMAGREEIPSEEEYYQRIGHKTAQFFAACCRLGGVSGGLPPPQCAILHTYGYHLGLAFQLQDDLLDWTPAGTVAGKPAGLDFSQGILTLPVLHALSASPQREELMFFLGRENPTAAEREQIRRLLEAAGSFTYVQGRVLMHLEVARAEAAKLGSAPLAERLCGLTEFIRQPLCK